MLLFSFLFTLFALSSIIGRFLLIYLCNILWPIETISTSKAIISLLEENLIEVLYSDNETIEIEDSLEINLSCLKLVGKSPFAVLIIPGEFTSFSAEVRELGARDTLDGERVATALLANSLSNKLIANFYLKFNKPSVPTKMFKTRGTAINWLRKCLNETAS